MIRGRRGSLPIVARAAAGAVAILIVAATHASAQDYRLERIASGLAQPTFMTQAPGDPSNILYYSTRVAPGSSGGSGTHSMGGIFRYDTNTRTSTQILDLGARQLTLDEGLVGFAFSPDFNTPGAPGYQKLYTSTSTFQGNGQSALDRVEEFKVNGPNGTVPVSSGQPIVNRLILQYTHVNNDQNHTIDWIGFDPTAASLPVGTPERNYLHIITGDGDLGGEAHTRPEQKANTALGKMLRVDVDASHPDAYSGDTFDLTRNFSIPATNPIPLWNASHDANNQLVGTRLNYTVTPSTVDYTPAFPEVYLTGLRNSFAASFDRQTGDWWGGDVGENAREEVNFFKAGTYNGSQPPQDYGYVQREGTIAGGFNSSGATSLTWVLSGGGTVSTDSVNPIREGKHQSVNTPDEVRTTGRSAYLGGYVYRGPVAELQGQYFYTDFVHGNVFQLDFDRDTPLASYSGNNFNQNADGVAALGTRTTVMSQDVGSLWQSLIVDPSDPSYTPAIGGTFGISRVISFAEDNSGNMYVIDFGGSRGCPDFGCDYPAAGTGEIFRITPTLAVTITINRNTGAMTVTNSTGQATDIKGYMLSSAAGTIDPASLTPVTGNWDVNGDHSVDGTNAWAITSAAGDHNEFGEGSTGGPASLSIGQSFQLSPSGGWIQSPYEGGSDTQFSVILGNGAVAAAQVVYEGNNGLPFGRSDLNFNGALDPGDWTLFKAGHGHVPGSLSKAQSYQYGDLDGDGDNDFFDFRIFQSDYNSANGAGALAALGGTIPEPASLGLAALRCCAGLTRRRRRVPTARPCANPIRGHRMAIPVALVLACVLTQTSAQAQFMLRDRFSFGEAAGNTTSGVSTVTDSVDGGNGLVIGTIKGNNGAFTGTALQLPGGTHAAGGAYVDLPNGFASSIHSDASFEAWYSTTTANTWARIWDFGSNSGAEITSAGVALPNANAGDAFFFAASRSTNISQQQVGIENDETINLGGVVGVTAPRVTLDPNVATSLGNPVHVVVNVERQPTPGQGPRMTIFMNGAQVATTNVLNSSQAGLQLEQLNDVNAWLGKSNYSGDRQFAGLLDEFRVYTGGVLSPSQIANHFAFGPGFLDPDPLRLEVNTFSGEVTIWNDSGLAFSPIDYYRVTSSDGLLSPDTWNSLDNQNVDAVGAGTGQSWDEGGGPTNGEVTELFLDGAATIAPHGTAHAGQAVRSIGARQAKAGRLAVSIRAPGRRVD